jgi:hypothetical protein
MNRQLNYMGKFQQFFTPSSSQNSFLRWTLHLDHTVFVVRKYAVGGQEHRRGWSRLLRTGGRDVPRASSYAELERLDRSAPAAVRVAHFGNQRRTLLFSADPRRVGPQQRVIARQLSGLSVSRTQFAALVGKLRALDLGSVWREADGGPRTGCTDTRRPGLQPPEA